MNEPPRWPDVDKFILGHIESVPHLEALLLIWNRRTRCWTVDDIAAALYVSGREAQKILRDLAQENLISESQASASRYSYSPSPQQDDLMGRLDSSYRRDLIRISRMIHSKGPSALREFARAFRLKKEE